MGEKKILGESKDYGKEYSIVEEIGIMGITENCGRSKELWERGNCGREYCWTNMGRIEICMKLQGE